MTDIEEGPEYKRLIDRLFNNPNYKLCNFSITPGERHCTAEELCAEVNKALDQIERGEAREIMPGEIDGADSQSARTKPFNCDCGPGEFCPKCVGA